MELDKVLFRLFQVAAKGYRHRDYKHVVKKRTLYMQLVAGVNLDKLLRRYVRREDEALFKQRVDLTQHIVTSVCANLLNPHYKVPRSNSARRVLTYKKDNNKGDEWVKDLEGALGRFTGAESWDDYLGTRNIELNAVDPNSFVVFEWDSFDPKKELLQPRPYEVSSVAAVDFKYVNKKLQYLIVEDTHYYDKPQTELTETDDKLEANYGKEKGKKFTMYGLNQTFRLLQVNESEVDSVGITPEQGVSFKHKKNNYVLLGEAMYQIEVFKQHKLGRVPAFRVGYVRDLETEGRTFVNPLHKIEPYLMKSIKTNSELDLVACNLAMPQQVAYGTVCQDVQCNGGQYADGSDCKTCHGTGMKPTAPSSQDAIRLPVPDSREEMIPLTELIKYVHPDVAIVQWQQQYVDYLTEKCSHLLYNSDTFTKKQVSETATGKQLDVQGVYDALHPFAVHLAKTWVFGVKVMADLLDRGKDLVASFSFGKDFKLKSLDTLIGDLERASKIGSAPLVQHISGDIMEIIFSERPLELQRYKLREAHNPFSGKSEKEVIALLSSPLVSRRQKVLHANYGSIFDELEIELANKKQDFYSLNRLEQRKVIYEYVDELIKQLDAENPEPTIPLD